MVKEIKKKPHLSIGIPSGKSSAKERTFKIQCKAIHNQTVGNELPSSSVPIPSKDSCHPEPVEG